jgi:hypothetical protein
MACCWVVIIGNPATRLSGKKRQFARVKRSFKRREVAGKHAGQFSDLLPGSFYSMSARANSFQFQVSLFSWPQEVVATIVLSSAGLGWFADFVTDNL